MRRYQSIRRYDRLDTEISFEGNQLDMEISFDIYIYISINTEISFDTIAINLIQRYQSITYRLDTEIPISTEIVYEQR